MSRLGKIFIALSVIAFLCLMAARFIMGEWTDYLWIPFVLFIVFFVLAILKDLAFYKEIFLMRTTKHGLNFGATVLIVVSALGAINYITYVENKKLDVTEEKFNSLSDQSVSVVKKLDSELEIIGFFKSAGDQDMREKFMFDELADLYKSENKKVITASYDPIRKPEMAAKYKVEASGEVVVSYKGKNTTVSEVSEESITNAIIKVTRGTNKIIYILGGHGELDVNSDSDLGASRFKKALEDTSYEVRPLSLVEMKAVPTDAAAVAILGGKQPLLDVELELLTKYAQNGGRLFIAADPGQGHNLGALTSKFGIEFKNDYILDFLGQLVGASAALAIGNVFSFDSEITKKFSRMMTVFQLASSLSKTATPMTGVQFDEIVKSSDKSISKKSIIGEIKPLPTDPKGPLTIGMTAKGKFPAAEGAEGGQKEFAVVAFGDSDFLTNQLLPAQLNRDLAVNSIAFLANDTELVSIRPKMAKGTTLQITDNKAEMLKWGVFLPIPLLMFAGSLVVWWRRREA